MNTLVQTTDGNIFLQGAGGFSAFQKNPGVEIAQSFPATGFSGTVQAQGAGNITIISIGGTLGSTTPGVLVGNLGQILAVNGNINITASSAFDANSDGTNSDGVLLPIRWIIRILLHPRLFNFWVSLMAWHRT